LPRCKLWYDFPMRKAILTVVLFLAAASARAVNTLDVYFIDVEGGQATLFVSPSGESMLVDTGWSDFNGRDADRIIAAAKLAGVKQIDYLVITHYHEDHVGGVPQLVERIPILNFVDHGPSFETSKRAVELYQAYLQARAKGNQILAKPGDRIPIRGVDVEVLTAAGDQISRPLAGAGRPNPLCATTRLREQDPSENARSIGMLITFGKFRIVDLGDLTWNKEYELVCPMNRVGIVDVYLSTHHGMNLSGSPAMVDALHPRVAIMNNGATKGGSPEAWQTIHNSPGLRDIWQLHYATAGGDANNAPDAFIANRDQQEGNWIKLSAESNGRFTVVNSRNGKSKTYQ
jgi:competence protein ComEC